MGIPYAAQLAQLDAATRQTFAGLVPDAAWRPPATGPESGFRNKAKLAVGGRRGAPTLGILDARGVGVDLRHCGLYEPGLAAVLPQLADLVSQLELTPYDVTTRTGELKHLILTHSPDGELMLRFVLRSPGQQPRIERALPLLHERLPTLRVVSVNLLPQHAALLEGAHEQVLTAQRALPMRLPMATLYLQPRSFFQTNTAVATALYAAAHDWTLTRQPARVLDLYCGVGGFALHLAQLPSRPSTLGVEVSTEAIESARLGAARLAERTSLGEVEFAVGDAAAYGPGSAELIVVNPPRRGIGADLARAIGTSGARHLLYSSCNPHTLAQDLAHLRAARVVSAQVFDMFPQSGHLEVLVLAELGD